MTDAIEANAFLVCERDRLFLNFYLPRHGVSLYARSRRAHPQLRRSEIVIARDAGPIIWGCR
jgi:hypothetical protein